MTVYNLYWAVVITIFVVWPLVSWLKDLVKRG